MNNTSTAIVWGNWGPYHKARFLAAKQQLPNCIGISFSEKSDNYLWESESESLGVINVCKTGKAQEDVGFFDTFWPTYKTLRERKTKVVFLPSYSPSRCFGALAAGKLAGCKCVMMNETHRLTASPNWLKSTIKKWILKAFDAGLVGGDAQIEYFEHLGMKRELLLPGYDVIDNQYYQGIAEETRRDEEHWRKELQLPDHYILSIGRFVKKKDLGTLIDAYGLLAHKSTTCGRSLLMVGSGSEEAELKARARATGMYADDLLENETEKEGHIQFKPFMQSEQVARVMALADVFVLPSQWEEWGLVVNESMASGTPVVVSNVVGSALSLVQHRENGMLFPPGNAGELANCLEELLQSDGLRNQIRENARYTISQWDTSLFGNSSRAIVEMLAS